LTGYNHTSKTIGAFYVNGIWAGNITPGSGGGSFVCCVALPSPWHAGTTVTVGWEDHEGKSHEQKVELPQYEDSTLSRLSVHFLRNGEITAYANRLSLWHPDYPLKGQEAELRLGVPIEVLPHSQ
jgi:hypothetical protein